MISTLAVSAAVALEEAALTTSRSSSNRSAAPSITPVPSARAIWVSMLTEPRPAPGATSPGISLTSTEVLEE